MARTQSHHRHDLNIIGAGPAGLVAAITAAKAGMKVNVYEKRKDVGLRFNNDYQGLENWSSPVDILAQLRDMAIETHFEIIPHYEIKSYDPYQNIYHSKSETPFYYLVRRGPLAGSLDTALKTQALEAGVNIHFQNTLQSLPQGGIASIGPRASDAIAVGYLFNTDLDDGAYVVLDDALAYKGYAYLLIHNHSATMATCLFDDFHNENHYLEKTLNFFQETLNFTMQNAKRFGGAINFILPTSAVKEKILYTGEAAGFQDPLWGFGLRYAMVSGYLAAQNFIHHDPSQQYDRAWKKTFKASLKTALVNRYLYNKCGNRGYKHLLKQMHSNDDAHTWLYKLYNPSLLRNIIYPWARLRLKLKRNVNYALERQCDCTWCRQHRK